MDSGSGRNIQAEAPVPDPLPKPAFITQSYRYRIDPTPEQAQRLDAALGASRFWHNQALELVLKRLKERSAALEAAGGDASHESVLAVVVPWDCKKLTSELDAARRDELASWRKEVPSGSHLAAMEALAASLKAFTRNRRAGKDASMPGFKVKGHCSEAVRFDEPRLLDDRRHLQLEARLGPLLTMESTRKLVRLLKRDPEARIKRAMLTRDGLGRYHVGFTVDRSRRLKERSPAQPGSVVGGDVGLKSKAVLSTGEIFANSRLLQHSLGRLGRLQKGLERQRRMANPSNYDAKGRIKPGRHTWKRTKRMERREEELRRLHAKVARQRREQAHLLSSYIVRNYSVIGVESLNITGMLKNRHLARAIADVGWGMILQMLRYKSDWRGRHLHAVGRFHPSSKTCSTCGTVRAKLSLGERTYHCEHCGLEIDRDLNAALNLAHEAEADARRNGIKDLHLLVAGTYPETRPGARCAGATGISARGAPEPPSCTGEDGAWSREGNPSGEPQSARADVVAVGA
jgi:putative transposase